MEYVKRKGPTFLIQPIFRQAKVFYSDSLRWLEGNQHRYAMDRMFVARITQTAIIPLEPI